LIKLIGIDVDGTLVGSSGTVPLEVWNAAERARSLGIRLALCSGRPAFGVALDYARRLDSEGWHVFQNGASIVDLETGASRSVALPPAHVAALTQLARTTHDVLELYSDGTYVTESTSDWAREHAEILGVPFQARPFESLTGPVVRAQWLLTRETAKRVANSHPPDVEVAESSSPLMPEVRFVGFTRKGVSKGSAIRMVAEGYGVALQDVMYVGDAGNDLPALQIVGHPIAMGNGDPAVRAIAARTVGDVESGGLMQAIELAIGG
jgi:Cof subfamily protein (haloacid dehalogenase superfamily)